MEYSLSTEERHFTTRGGLYVGTGDKIKQRFVYEGNRRQECRSVRDVLVLRVSGPGPELTFSFLDTHSILVSDHPTKVLFTRSECIGLFVREVLVVDASDIQIKFPLIVSIVVNTSQTVYNPRHDSPDTHNRVNWKCRSYCLLL